MTPMKPEKGVKEAVLDMSTLDSVRNLGPLAGPNPVEELCALYLEDMADRVASARRAAEAGESAEVVRQAHAIKGAAGNFGANRMYVVARHLQEIAGTEEAQAVARELERELEEVRAVIEGEVLGHRAQAG